MDMGSLKTNEMGNNSNSNINETMWFSTSIFPVGGQLIKYDIPQWSI